MLISNFVKTAAYVSLSDIQFATSIALDLLGEETAASKVLTLFLDTTETTESSAHPRNVLEGYLREKYGDGIVLGFISTIYDGEYIELRKDSLYDTKKKVSLKSLLQHTSLENVYNKTMQLLAENPTSKLIYIYTKTSMWFKQFKPRAVPIALQGNTDLIIRLNDAFAEESVKQFCDSGAYESSTCTPQYFLLYAYAHWFKDKKTYIQIVNSRSTLRGTSSEDKRSILDKYVEDSDTYADDNVAYGFDNGLDFRNIASKIYQASISLFNHLSSLTAYDDIFSWYKSSLIEEIRRKNKGSLDSMKRYYELVILEEDSYLSNEKKRKRIARYKLCHQFSTILEQGLALEDMPHIKSIAATDDADYIISVLADLEREMSLWNNIYVDNDVKNISDFRKKTGLCIPRHVIVIDEFQTMLKKAGKKSNEIMRILYSFAKLGRNTGFHLLLASQEIGSDIPSLICDYLKNGYKIYLLEETYAQLHKKASCVLIDYVD